MGAQRTSQDGRISGRGELDRASPKKCAKNSGRYPLEPMPIGMGVNFEMQQVCYKGNFALYPVFWLLWTCCHRTSQAFP